MKNKTLVVGYAGPMVTTLVTTVLYVLELIPLSTYAALNLWTVLAATLAVLVVSGQKNVQRVVWPFTFSVLGYGTAALSMAPVILALHT